MSYLAKNIRVLKQHLPVLAQWVEDGPPCDWFKAKGNQLYVKHGLTFKAAYNSKDPLRNTDSVSKQTQLYATHVNVIVGLGLGHTVMAALRAKEPKHIVVVIEPSAAMVREAFTRYDFTYWIKNKSFVLCAPGIPEINHVLHVVDAGRVVENWYLTAEPYALWRNEYIPLMDFAGQLLNQMRCNTGTVMSNGSLIAANDIKCLPYVLRYRGVNELADIFKGKPAIIVSTGPSLARNIHMLRELQERAVIVAVGQALRPLLAYGIRPDLICTVDFGPVNMAHYRGLMDVDVPMVTLNRTFYEVLRQYKGMKFISASVDPALSGTVHGLLLDKGTLVQGGSVAHMAAGTAIHMGCDPVVFVGQDLAVGDTSHIPLVDAMGRVKRTEAGELRWDVTDQRSGINDKTHSMGEAVHVPGYYGDTATTNTGLASFITAFETIFAQHPGRRFINATEGGARIDGAYSQFLYKVASQHMTEPVDKSPLKALCSYADNAEELIAKAIPLLETDIAALKEIIDNAEKAIKSTEQFEEGITTGKLNKRTKALLLMESNKYTTAAERAVKKHPLITLTIYWASRAISSRSFDTKRTDLKYLLSPMGAKDLKVRLERTKLILTNARDAATDILKHSQEALEILKTGTGEPTGEVTGPDFTDAGDYLDTGNFAHPLVDLILSGAHLENFQLQDLYIKCKDMMNTATDKAEAQQRVDLEMGRDKLCEVVYLVHRAHKTGIAGDYTEALRLLDTALGLLPAYEQALWGKASTLVRLKRHSEAMEVYDKLLASNPTKAPYIFERGVAMTKIGQIDEGIKEIKRAMEGTTDFDAFFKVLAELHERAGERAEALAAYEYYHTHVAPYDDEVKGKIEAFSSA